MCFNTIKKKLVSFTLLLALITAGCSKENSINEPEDTNQYAVIAVSDGSFTASLDSLSITTFVSE
jgi:hypothetical protein